MRAAHASTDLPGIAYAFTSRPDVRRPFEPLRTGPDGPGTEGIPDASAALIVAEDVDRWTACTLADGFTRLYRSLRPQGLLRVTARDLDEAVLSYCYDGQIQPDGPSRAAELRRWFGSVGFACNEEDLRSALHASGFVEVRRFVAGSGSVPAFWDFEPPDPGLLVLEARRPLGAE